MLKIRIENFINNNISLVFDIVVCIIIICIFAISTYIFEYSNVNELTIEIKDKYVKNNGNNDKYIVIDSNNNAYEISDLFFIWKFNSTDIYNLLEIGNKYTITTSGIRARFFSTYPNINKVKDEKE